MIRFEGFWRNLEPTNLRNLDFFETVSLSQIYKLGLFQSGQTKFL